MHPYLFKWQSLTFEPSLIGLHNCKAETPRRTDACGHRYSLNETHRRLKEKRT